MPVPGPRGAREVVATSLNLSDWEGLIGSPAYARFGGLRTAAAPACSARTSPASSPRSARASRASRSATRCTATTCRAWADSRSSRSRRSRCSRSSPQGSRSRRRRRSRRPGRSRCTGTATARPGIRMLINGGGRRIGRVRDPARQGRRARTSPVSTTPASSTSCATLGADAVIDYRAEDFTRTGPYDLILDLVAHRSVFAYRRALAPGGRYLAVGGDVRNAAADPDVGTAQPRASRAGGWASSRCARGPAQFEAGRANAARRARSASTSTAPSRCDETADALRVRGRGASTRQGGRRALSA